MKKIDRYLETGVLALCLALIAAFCFVPPVHAESGMVYGSSIPAGQIVQGDVILTGTNVSVDGSVDGDLLAVGQNVTINGTVSGSLIAIGSKVVINGTVQGTAYISAVTMVVGPEATLERNLYYSGVSLVTKNGSILGRDLYALAFGSTNQGKITGQTQAVVGPYEVFKWIIEQLKINVQLPETLSPTSYSGGSGGGVILANYRQDTADQTHQFLQGLSAWGMPIVQDLVPLLILGLILVWLFPGMMSKSARKISARPWYSLGVGLLIFIISLNIIGVVLLLAALIFVIGLGFGFLSLWGLAAIWWALAFLCLFLAAALFFLMVFEGSRLVVSYLIGLLILRKTPETSYLRRVGILALGLVIFLLIASIPVFGWVVGVIAISLGLGGIWQAYMEHRAERKWVNDTEKQMKAGLAESGPEKQPTPAAAVAAGQAPKGAATPKKKAAAPKKKTAESPQE